MHNLSNINVLLLALNLCSTMGRMGYTYVCQICVSCNIDRAGFLPEFLHALLVGGPLPYNCFHLTLEILF